MSEIACEAGLWYNLDRNIVVLGSAVNTPSRIHLIGDVPMDTLPPHASNDNPSIPTASGIYKITCTANKKIYIGSSINMRKRKKQHFDKLRLNGHDNPKLQAAWNKYGPDAFTYEVLELVLPLSLTAREQYWFHKLKPFGKRGFNIVRDAAAPPSALGRKQSPEMIEKLRKRNLGNTYGLGRKDSPAMIEQKRQRNLGNRYGLGNKSRSGQVFSDEIRENMRKGQIDKEFSPEHREKISQAKFGKKNSPEHIEHSRRGLLGRVNKSQMKTYILTAPDGIEHVVHGISPFCREHNLDASCLVGVAKGKFKQHKGWKARYCDEGVI